MDALLYDDDDTPDVLAVASKEKGNAAYLKGRAFHGNALRYYKDALEHCKREKRKQCSMRTLESQVRANMAAIYFDRSEFTAVLNECITALEVRGCVYVPVYM